MRLNKYLTLSQDTILTLLRFNTFFFFTKVMHNNLFWWKCLFGFVCVTVCVYPSVCLSVSLWTFLKQSPRIFLRIGIRYNVYYIEIVRSIMEYSESITLINLMSDSLILWRGTVAAVIFSKFLEISVIGVKIQANIRYSTCIWCMFFYCFRPLKLEYVYPCLGLIENRHTRNHLNQFGWARECLAKVFMQNKLFPV